MSREAFVSQVMTALVDRLTGLEQYLGTPQEGLRKQAYVRAAELHEALDDPHTAPSAARAVMAGMWASDDVPHDFWKTEAGQQVARAVGYHREAVPYMAAAAILGVSRQRVYQLTDEGKLRRIEGQHAVTPSSVREVLMGGGRA